MLVKFLGKLLDHSLNTDCLNLNLISLIQMIKSENKIKKTCQH